MTRAVTTESEEGDGPVADQITSVGSTSRPGRTPGAPELPGGPDRAVLSEETSAAESDPHR